MSKELNFQQLREHLHQCGQLSLDEIMAISEFYDRPDLSAFSITSITRGEFQLAHYQMPSNGLSPKRAWLIHGLLDHSIYMLRVAEVLSRLGYQVNMLDLPGHGLSVGERGRINDFRDYAELLKGQVRANDLFVGFSTGCVAWLENMVCERAVLIAPLIRSRGYRWSVAGVSLLRFLGQKKITRGPSAPSHDQEFLKWRARDPMSPGEIDLYWCQSLIKWNREVVDHWQSDSSRTPLIVYGTSDRTLEALKGAKKLEERFNTKVKWIHGAGHNIICESDEYYRALELMITDYCKF